MAFRGWTRYDERDVPVWDRIDDVPPYWLREGRPIGLPTETIPYSVEPGTGLGVQEESPLAWLKLFGLALIANLKWVLIILALAFLFLTTVAFMAPYLPQRIEGTECIALRGCAYCPDTDGKLVPVDPNCVPTDPGGDIAGTIAIAAVAVVGGYGLYKLISHESRKREARPATDQKTSKA